MREDMISMTSSKIKEWVAEISQHTTANDLLDYTSMVGDFMDYLKHIESDIDLISFEFNTKQKVLQLSFDKGATRVFMGLYYSRSFKRNINDIEMEISITKHDGQGNLKPMIRDTGAIAYIFWKLTLLYKQSEQNAKN